MEEKLNSYLGMAHSDYLYARAGMQVGEEYGNYNGVASMCAQSAEKYLKAVLEQCMEGTEVIQLLKSHNLRAILNCIKETYTSLEIDSKDIKWLGDFYFDARYPGDNFVVVSKDDALEALRIVETLQPKIMELINQNRELQKQVKKKISELPLFFL